MNAHVDAALAAWESTVSIDETSDPIWQLLAYRVARCLLDAVQQDSVIFAARADSQTAAQLSRAVASIGANIAEGYSRGSAPDRARFYSYAFGSAREAVIWYRSLGRCLDGETLAQRMAFLAFERRLLVGLLKSVQRSGRARYTTGL